MYYSRLYNTVFLILWLLSFDQGFSQNAKKAPEQVKGNINQPDTSKNKKIIINTSLQEYKYSLSYAIRYKDYNAAINIMYHIMGADPKPAFWLDSLCTLYFMSNSFSQCILVAGDIEALGPLKEKTGLMKAISYRNIGNIKEALNSYEKLYSNFKNPYYLYEIAEFQFLLKRMAEFEVSIMNLLKIADESKTQPELSITTEKGETQKVPLKAAVLNLKGVMLKETNQPKEAGIQFEEALKIMPDFKLAKTNLENLDKK